MSRKKKSNRGSAEPAFLAVDFFCGAGGTTRGLIGAGGYVMAGIDKASGCRETYVENNVNAFIDYSTPRYLDYDIFPATKTYLTGSKVVCTSRFGIAQFRKRSILLAVRRELVKSERLADLIGSELLVPEADPDTVMVSVREAIDHLPPIGAGETHATVPNHRTRTLSALNLQRLASAAPGQSNAYMENTEFGDLSLDCHRKVNRRLKVRCFSDVYTRMHPDRPSPTITTKCHSISNGRFGHYNTAQVRGISLREAAILQSFPEDYVFHPTDQIEPIASMIGNAVPPKLAAFFADYLVKSIEGRLGR